jgi:hypothetical protein
LNAAREENLRQFGGAPTPDILRLAGVAPRPVPKDVLRLRQMIDEVLVATIELVTP